MTAQGTVTFVPSVHFSPTHRRRVRDTIRENNPDIVAVELDERRFEGLVQNSRLNPAELAQEVPPATAATYNTLKAIQRTIVQLYGLDPGKTEMETAIETAAEMGADVALVDEPITDTIDALSNRVGIETLPKMLIRMQLMGPKERIAQFGLWMRPFTSIESGDDVQPMVDQMRRLLPEVTEVLIDQRDWAMAQRLHSLRNEGNDVLAVVGAGHHNGIRDALEDLETQDADPDVAVPMRSLSQNGTDVPVN